MNSGMRRTCLADHNEIGQAFYAISEISGLFNKKFHHFKILFEMLPCNSIDLSQVVDVNIFSLMKLQVSIFHMDHAGKAVRNTGVFQQIFKKYLQLPGEHHNI